MMNNDICMEATLLFFFSLLAVSIMYSMVGHGGASMWGRVGRMGASMYVGQGRA